MHTRCALVIGVHTFALPIYRRGVTITAAGASFYADARNILALLDQAGNRANAIVQGQIGRIDVGVFGSSIFDLIPRIVLAFREKFPDVEVSLHTMSREEQVKALVERRIDRSEEHTSELQSLMRNSYAVLC